MPYVISVDPERRYETVRFHGQVTEQDVRQCWYDFDVAPGHRRDHGLIFDMRDSSLNLLTPESVRYLASVAHERNARELHRTGNVAVLVSANLGEVNRQIIDLFTLHLERIDKAAAAAVRVFTDLESAYLWIEVEEPGC